MQQACWVSDLEGPQRKPRGAGQALLGRTVPSFGAPTPPRKEPFHSHFPPAGQLHPIPTVYTACKIAAGENSTYHKVFLQECPSFRLSPGFGAL